MSVDWVRGWELRMPRTDLDVIRSTLSNRIRALNWVMQTRAGTMRARPVAIIAVSLLLIAGATGFQVRRQVLHLLGADRPISGSAPHAIGNKWACPDVWIKAYSSGLYYPSYHPAPPPLQTMPTRCYRTQGDARVAGYKIAPPPAGGVILDGVYLVPASSQIKSNCQAAATQLGIAIPCPTMLPADVADSLCSPSAICIDDMGAFVAPVVFTTPPDFPGAIGDPGAAVRAGFVALGQVQLLLAAFPDRVQVARPSVDLCIQASGPTVMQQRTLWLTCRNPNDPNGTLPPAALTWDINKAHYLVEALIHPDLGQFETSTTQRLVQFFASKLTPVLPAGG
jgi:hypothetical protein